jgi:CHAT domain-containing protein
VVARSPTATIVQRPAAVVRAFVLESADSLAPAIARFVSRIEQGGNTTALGRDLSRATIDSALAALGSGITHLIIVPDGPLHRLPFDALSLSDGSRLISRYAVSLAPSAAAMRAIWRRPRPAAGDPRPMRLLALADPAFGGHAGYEADGSDQYRDLLDSTGALPRLAESGREARLVARYAPFSEVRLGSNASAAYLLHAPMDQFRVIHIATHALVDERSLARTALALAPGDGENGFVTPAQLAGLHLRADLVVLSACRTAGGVIIDGDGVQGLTGPLLAAGARSIVATQWRIGDRSAVPFITAFYGALARGLTVADALRAAKLDAIARGGPAAEWAAFTVVGDPFVRLALRYPPSPVRQALIIVGLLLAIGLALVVGIRYSRRRTA